MNNKIIFTVIIIVLFVGITTVVNAESLNLFNSKKHTITVTLKNDAKIDKAKETISKIPQIKIINIQDRDKEWSKMVNKMDLPNMENPFKHEFIIRVNKKADINEIYSKLNEFDFVENIKDNSDTGNTKNNK